MKKILLLLIICVAFSGLTVLAADAPNVTATLDIEDYYVEISASGLTPYQRVILVAVPEGSTAEQVLLSGASAYLQQIETGAGGTVNTRVLFSSYAEAVKYKICVLDIAGTYSSRSFQYLIESQATPAKNSINSANATTMYAALSGCDVSLALDMTEYDRLPTEADKKTVASLLYSERPQGGFEDIASIHKAFGKAVATVSAPLASSPYTVIEKYADNLGIDTTNLTSLTADEKSAFDTYVKTKTYSDADDLVEGCDEAIFTAKIRCAKTAGEVENMIFKAYPSRLILDRTYYDKLISPSDVITAIFNSRTNIDGFADAKSKFEASAYQAYQNQPTQGQSQGSSSSGGFPAVSPQKPVVAPQTSSTVYTDLQSVQWAVDSIELLTKRGVVSGDGNGRFRPNDTVTRAEFLKMLVVAMGIQSSGANTDFDDVAPDAWYSSYIATGVSCGIVNGITASAFEPDMTITRQDIAVMCKRALDYTNTSLDCVRETSLNDFDTVSDYAVDGVKTLYQIGIINGYEDGTFKPMQGATRAEVAKMVASLINSREAVN